jgi:hypothetical protein
MKSKYKSSAGQPSSLPAIFVAVAFLGTLVVGHGRRSGLPVDTGSHFPVALWAIGAAVLGLVLVYGLRKYRRRTKSDAQLTERATKNLYAKEDQAEHPNHPRDP